MTGKDFGILSIVWMFLLVAGGWLLVNALVDLGAPRFIKWLGSKLQAIRHALAAGLERIHDRVVEPRLR